MISTIHIHLYCCHLSFGSPTESIGLCSAIISNMSWNLFVYVLKEKLLFVFSSAKFYLCQTSHWFTIHLTLHIMASFGMPYKSVYVCVCEMFSHYIDNECLSFRGLNSGARMFRSILSSMEWWMYKLFLFSNKISFVQLLIMKNAHLNYLQWRKSDSREPNANSTKCHSIRVSYAKMVWFVIVLCFIIIT